MRRKAAGPGLRFAFYGRTSTDRFQDRWTSRGWQREVAAELVAGHGRIVQEFFDVGVSRRVPWQEQPRAAELLELIDRPDCPFDAIVVGGTSGHSSLISSPSCCRGRRSAASRSGCPRPAAGSRRVVRCIRR